MLTVALGAFALVWLFPFIWTLVSSLKSPVEISSRVWALPSTIYWENFAHAFEGLSYVRSLRNSLFVAISTGVL
ncbi:MAG: carbohydrate ABC transporter permease, partial [Spirochaetia bacterium]